MRCGLCLPTCPTYLETMTETSGPRGRISLIKAVDEGRLDLPQPRLSSQQMSECLDCRACEAVCPSGVPYGQLLEDARARRSQEERSRSPGRAHAPRPHALAVPHSSSANRRSSCAPPPRCVRFAQRTRLDVAGRGRSVSAMRQNSHRESRRASFSPTDRASKRPTPSAPPFCTPAASCRSPFRRFTRPRCACWSAADLNVVVPARRAAAARSPFTPGRRTSARELARKKHRGLRGRTARTSTSSNAAGCGSTLKEYADLFAGRSRVARTRASASPRASATSPKCSTPSNSTPHRPDRRRRHVPGAVPSRARAARHRGAAAAARQDSRTASDRNERKRGVLRQRRHLQSHAARDGGAPAAPQGREHRATGADIVATANPGCAMQVAAGLRADGSDARVAHIVELLDEAYAAYRPL